MIPQEILKKVRQLEITTRDLVNSVFCGEYHSVFKGKGMEFSEVREYQYGDDIRQIDWNVTARMRSPFVKVFSEEREQILMLVVDASGSGEFGSGEQMKGEIAVEIAALLAFSAIKNNDRVGLLIFTDRIEKFVPPKKGKAHVLRVLRELLYFKPEGRGTDLGLALEYLTRVIRRRSVVLLVSDFLDSGFEKPLKVVNSKHDVIALTIRDPCELAIPPVGLVQLEDAETGERILVDTSSREFQQEYRQLTQGRHQRVTKFLDRLDVDHVDIDTSRGYVRPLVQFFRRRARALGAGR
ncbi:MAG: DUF58 domain-containing protein [Candidatus Riflebacteria bacterium]|nr:DUF58 domain-containing protein [Candidatus Riflebacteria bacterium]